MAVLFTYEKALNAMRQLCSKQEKCHADIRTNLIKKGIYGLDLENIIATLIEEGYLDEERYARSFVRGKFRNNNWGRIKIRSGLKQKQISDYCIKKGLQEIDEEDYLQKIKELIQKKKRLVKGENAYVIIQKILRFMVSKGYEPELIHRTINKMDPVFFKPPEELEEL